MQPRDSYRGLSSDQAARGDMVESLREARLHSSSISNLIPSSAASMTSSWRSARLHGSSNVEAAIGEIIDPFGVSAPLRSGLVFTDASGVPEPAFGLLVGG